jgi:hypothetical protein
MDKQRISKLDVTGDEESTSKMNHLQFGKERRIEILFCQATYGQPRMYTCLDSGCFEKQSHRAGYILPYYSQMERNSTCRKSLIIWENKISP